MLSRLIGGDLSLVNSSKYQERFIALPLARPLHFVITYFDRKPSVKPNYFKLLTQEHVDAAHNALAGSPIPFPKNEGAPAVREFNLDIAKLLLQFASIVYERKNKAIHESIDHSKTQAAKSAGFSLFSTPDLLSPAVKKVLSGDHFNERGCRRKA